MLTIYVDESGPFIPMSGKSRVSCIGALLLSSRITNDLFEDFARLSTSFSLINGEVKGSRLDETAIASVIALLARYDVLAEIIMIDAGIHRDGDVTAFRRQQAEYIHHHSVQNPDFRVRELAKELSGDLEVMPNQLFIQAWLTMLLVVRVVQTAALYHALEAPRDLAAFDWTIDRKGAGLTSAEEFWTTFVLPFSETRSKNQPLLLLSDGDYSEFARFINGGVDFHAILTEHLAFKDSRSEPGLQLVDIVVNACARAFNGRLQERGWEGLPCLFAGIEPQVLQLVALTRI